MSIQPTPFRRNPHGCQASFAPSATRRGPKSIVRCTVSAIARAPPENEKRKKKKEKIVLKINYNLFTRVIILRFAFLPTPAVL